MQAKVGDRVQFKVDDDRNEYFGTVKKIVMDESGTSYFIHCAPGKGQNWIQVSEVQRVKKIDLWPKEGSDNLAAPDVGDVFDTRAETPRGRHFDD